MARSLPLLALSLAVLPLAEGRYALAAEKTELFITERYKDEPPVQHTWGADAEISVSANRYANRPADRVYINFYKKGHKPEESASLEFSTEKLNSRGLRPGSYPWAQRAAFEPEGVPGIHITVGSYGADKLGGEFKVLAASYRRCAGVITVTRFAATFQIFAGFSVFKGHIYYRYDPNSADPAFSFEQCPLAPSPRATAAPRSEQEPEQLPAYWRRALPAVVRALAGR